MLGQALSIIKGNGNNNRRLHDVLVNDFKLDRHLIYCEISDLYAFRKLNLKIERIDEADETPAVGTSDEDVSTKIATSPLQVLKGMIDGKKPAATRVDFTTLSIDEKIKTIVGENPEFNTREIRNALDEERFGNVKINWLELRRRLKALSLDSMRKRVIFARKNL